MFHKYTVNQRILLILHKYDVDDASLLYILTQALNVILTSTVTKHQNCLVMTYTQALWNITCFLDLLVVFPLSGPEACTPSLHLVEALLSSAVQGCKRSLPAFTHQSISSRVYLCFCSKVDTKSTLIVFLAIGVDTINKSSSLKPYKSSANCRTNHRRKKIRAYLANISIILFQVKKNSKLSVISQEGQLTFIKYAGKHTAEYNDTEFVQFVQYKIVQIVQKWKNNIIKIKPYILI